MSRLLVYRYDDAQQAALAHDDALNLHDAREIRLRGLVLVVHRLYADLLIMADEFASSRFDDAMDFHGGTVLFCDDPAAPTGHGHPLGIQGIEDCLLILSSLSPTAGDSPVRALLNTRRSRLQEWWPYAKGCDVSVEVEETGPIDYLVVEFPGNRMTGEGLPILLDLVDRGLIRVLDLRFVSKDQDGTLTAVEISDLQAGGDVDLSVFEGAASGLLGQDDLDELGSVLDVGSSAAMLVYENVWAAPFAAALRRGGAQLVATGRIPIQAILAALDEQDSNASA